MLVYALIDNKNMEMSENSDCCMRYLADSLVGTLWNVDISLCWFTNENEEQDITLERFLTVFGFVIQFRIRTVNLLNITYCHKYKGHFEK